MSQWTLPEQQQTSDMDIVLSCSSLKILKAFLILSLLEISFIWEGTFLTYKRFAFEVYDESFQARNNPATYCSWALLHGDAQNKDFAEYQLSKADFNLN